MAKAKELYISLRDDPDLNIPEGDTRESAAWNEMSHRMRQHQTNSKALSLGNDVAEPSSVEKFADFIEKAKRIEAIPVGPFKSKSEFLGYLKDFSGGTGVPGFGRIEKWFSGLPKAKQNQLATNMNEYQDDLGDYSASLRGEERDNFLKHLADNKHPFTVDEGADVSELRSKGYVAKGQRASGGKYRLTPEGASHLIGDSRLRPRKGSKDPFNISANRFNQHSVDLTDADAEWQAAERVEREDTPEVKRNRLVRDLVDGGIAEDRKAAQKIVRETTDDDTDFDAHYDKISDYYEELGGHPLKSSGSKGHIDNLNNETANPVRAHVPPTAKAPPTEEAPEEEKFEAIQIYDQGRFTADDFDSEGKLNPELFEGDGEFADLPDAQKEHLQGITFESGKDYKTDTDLDKVVKPKAKAAAAKPKAKPAGRKRATTTAAKQPKTAAPTSAAEEPKAEEPKAEEREVSVEQHESIRKMIKVLRDKHLGKTTDESKSFNDFAGSKEDAEEWFKRMLRNELTKDDVALLGNHLQNNSEDLDDLRKKGISSADTNYPLLAHGEQVAAREAKVRTAAGQGDPPPPIKDETEIDGEDGEDGEAAKAAKAAAAAEAEEAAKAAAKKKADAAADKSPEQIEREDKVGDLIAHHSDGLKAAYEKEYGPVEDNTDENDYSFDDYKAGLLQEHSSSDVKVGNFKKFAAKHTNTARKAEATKESTKATKDKAADVKAEKDARTDKVKDLQARAAGSDLKMSKKEAEALIDEHGDADTAFDAHETAFADKTKKQESANELPYTTDDLSKKIFGDVDPTSRLTHLSEDRKKNKYGEVSTSLARELIAHYKTYSGVMDKKTEKELIEQLAFLKDPSKRFPNMRIPKGEIIGADIKAANEMVKEAEEKGYALDGPEAARLYEKREDERTRRVQHHQTAHVNPTTDENKKISHGEGADPDEEKTGVFSKTDNTSSLHFDEDGNVTGRKRRGSDGEEQHESFKTDGSDDHHLRGDHEARGSRVKEHVVPSHGNHLDDNEKESLESLKEAHKAKEDAVRSGDEAASAKADEDIAQHTKDLEESGLKQSDFLHDEGDEPKIGPPNPDVAVRMRAQGLDWNEEGRNWVSKDGHDARSKAGSSFSHVGDGAAMGIHTAEMGADGVINQAHDTRTFLHSSSGYHVVDPNHDYIPSSHAGVQAQKLGQIPGINTAASESSNSGKPQMIAAREHSHLTAHGTHDRPPDALERATGAAKKVIGGAAKWARGGFAEGAESKPKPKAGSSGFGDRIKDLFKEHSNNLSAVQTLQLHIELQKLEEKQKIAV